MVAALELDDGVATGVAAGQADGAHGRLGARADHPHHIHARHDLADTVGQLDFQFRGGAEAQPFRALPDDRLSHLGVIVAHDHRPPGQHVVDIALARAVKDIGPVAAIDKYRGAAHGLEGPHRGVDAAGDVAPGALKQLL